MFIKKKFTIFTLIFFSLFLLAGISGCTDDGGSSSATDADKNLQSFSFLAANNIALGSDVTATITGTTISATVPNGTDVSALIATFTTDGQSVAVSNVDQVSGTTANDFTSSVTYTVTAADGTTQDYTVTVTIAAASHKIIFLSATYNGSLGGLAGADAKCQTEANNASLSGTFKAFLSDSTTNVKDRLFHNTGPYKRKDGALIANDWDALISGSIDNAINIKADGSSSDGGVWTGTTTTFTTGAHCSDWTDNSPFASGKAGLTTGVGSAWVDNSSPTCNIPGSLYCVEQ